MNNRELAEVFTLIADLSEIKGEIIYKTLAYRKAAENLAGLGPRCQRILEGEQARRDSRRGQGHR